MSKEEIDEINDAHFFANLQAEEEDFYNHHPVNFVNNYEEEDWDAELAAQEAEEEEEQQQQ